jgi:peptide deformylase
MAVREILRLGNPDLHRVCRPVSEDELPFAKGIVQDLHDTLFHFRERHGVGRAIAAPQIGAFIRIVYCHTGSPIAMLNPVLFDLSDEMITLWDDCMSFPDLLVKVHRHRKCAIRFKDLDWKDQEMRLEEAMSELLQHEVDHLDGILALARAVDAQSFSYRSELKDES